MHLVYEQHAVAGGFQLVDHLLQALFELAPVLGARHQRAHVQRHDPPSGERARNVTVVDALRQLLDNGRLADARLADEHGVVLRAAAENLHDPVDFQIASYHRVELVLAGQRGQVGAQLVQRGRPGGAARLLGGLPCALAEDAARLRPHLVQGHAKAFQHPGRHTFAFAHEADEQVLRPDVVVAEAPRFVHGEFDHLLGAGGQSDFAGRRALAAADDELDR